MSDVHGSELLHHLALGIAKEQWNDEQLYEATIDAAIARLDGCLRHEKSDMAWWDALREARVLAGDPHERLAGSTVEHVRSLLNSMPDASPEKHFMRFVVEVRAQGSHVPDASHAGPLGDALLADPWNAIYLTFAQEADELCGTELARLRGESNREQRAARRLQRKI